MQGFFGSSPELTSGAAIMADPPLLCSPLKNGKDAKGKIVVAQRGACNFIQKGFLANAAGAVGLMVIDNKKTFGLNMAVGWRDASNNGPGTPCTVGGPPDGDPPGCNPHVPIPAVSLLKTDGDALVDLMQTRSVSFEIKTAKIKSKDFEVLKKVYDSTLFISQARSSLFLFWCSHDSTGLMCSLTLRCSRGGHLPRPRSHSSMSANQLTKKGAAGRRPSQKIHRIRV